MARIRTIKPEFWGDEKMAPMCPIDRLVFLGLICMADDAGRLVDNVKTIDGFLFPETDDTARDALVRLAAAGRILRYASESAQRLIQITHWGRHQKVDHAAKYVLPAPRADAATDSRESRETVARPSRSDLRPVPTTGDLGPTTSGVGDGAGASELDAPEPRRRPTEAVAGHIAPAAGDLATDLVRAANQAVTEVWGESPDPYVASSGAAHELATAVQDAEIPADFAERAVFTVCHRFCAQAKRRGAAPEDRRPGSMAYFPTAVRREWAKYRAGADARAMLAPEVLPEPPRATRFPSRDTAGQDGYETALAVAIARRDRLAGSPS